MYDAIVIGSGPNGLAAAITLARTGKHVKIFELRDTTGGGTRTLSLTLPEFKHDICSAIHPLGYASPFLSSLPLTDYGLEWIHPDIPLSHPLDSGRAVHLYKSLEKTAQSLGVDRDFYTNIFEPLTNNWNSLAQDILAPLQWPNAPIQMAKFGFKAIQSAQKFAGRNFKTLEAKAVFGGLAAHSILSLDRAATSGIGLVLGILAHHVGWPFPKGGSQELIGAMSSYFKSLGGEIETGFRVESLDQLPESATYFFDTTPKQMVDICGDKLSNRYKKRVSTFKYGHGVFKIDAALSEPIPWQNKLCQKAGTVHVGGTLEEICYSENQISNGKHPEKPYVLVAQQSNFDNTRAPGNSHTLWAYCHVPSGSEKNMTQSILDQIERFAPGFRDCILETHTTNTREFETYNPNYIGGDINGGAANITQLFTRPIVKRSPYSTSNKKVYICSSSTPPGGGVHGMCGYHAARAALKSILK